jgi:ABC-type multidrug transport system ATPase subunit
MDSICISHLSKKFGKNQVLEDISLTVQSGEIFSYLGPNGAGKTTTQVITEDPEYPIRITESISKIHYILY